MKAKPSNFPRRLIAWLLLGLSALNLQLSTPAQAQPAPVLADPTTGAIHRPAAITGNLVGTTATQTLTNKTISLGSNTLTATSAQLATALSDETGSGSVVFATSPTLVTPNIGAATGTSVNLTGGGTFGGNLTVSGTGTTSIAGTLAANGAGNHSFGGDILGSGSMGFGGNTSSGRKNWVSGNTNQLLLWPSRYYSGGAKAATTGNYSGKLEYDATGGAWTIGGTTSTQTADAAVTNDITFATFAPTVATFGTPITVAGTGTSTIAGNLTVSGTGNHTFSGSIVGSSSLVLSGGTGGATLTLGSSSSGAASFGTNVVHVGKAGTGTGGNYRMYDDGGTSRWLAGLLGSAGERSYSIYDVANAQSRISIASTADSVANGTFNLNATVAGTLAVSGTGTHDIRGITQHNRDGYAIELKSLTTANPRAIRFTDGGTATKYNWQVGAQINIDNGYEITPSTAVAGSTFSSPGFTVLATGGVQVQSTSTVKGIRTASATLDFPSVSASGGVQELTVTVTGAVVGDSVTVNSAAGATMPANGLTIYGQVTSANTVTVRATNTTGSSIDPVNTTYRVTVIGF